MLRRLSLKDFVIVDALELEFGAGFSVLTGETGAGKSILIDALQLALGARAEGGVVREGCARSEITAEFDSPASLAGWLDEAGFAVDEALLLRRVVDAQGKSRAFVNGSAATLTQLREGGARPPRPGPRPRRRWPARASARASSTPNASASPGSRPRWSGCRRRTTSGR